MRHVHWDDDHVWLFTQGHGVISVNCETFSVVRIITTDIIRAPYPVPNCELVFGVSNGIGTLIGRNGKAVFVTPVTGKGFEVVDGCTPLFIPNLAVIVAWSHSGLQSWRFDYVGPCPSEVLLPKKAESAPVIVKVTDAATVAAKKPLPKLPLSMISDFSEVDKDATLQAVRGGTSLYLSRRAMLRATLTCDEHGKIISANAAVQDIFGHDPTELVDTSCRRLFFLPRVKQRTGSILLYSARGPQRFSETDLWRSLMRDLLQVRVVNGQHKDGSHVPLLISSSELVIAGLRFYALLFEQMPKSAAILIVDGSGLITSSSENLSNVIGWNTEHASGKTINALIAFPMPTTYLTKRKIDPTVIINASAKTPTGQNISIGLQVLDFANEAYTIMVKPAERQSLSLVSEEKMEQLNHYSLGAVLGVGMCGEVREGVHKLTGTKVAVKRLKRKQFEQSGLAFSDRELELMKDLVHPNVIELFDCIRMVDEICLVMELLSGQELFSFCVEHAPLDESFARKFFRDILSGVDYIHSKGVVHRDLKLENCMVVDKDRVKIIDFGLGNFFLRGPLHTSCGSPSYAAPELFLSKQYYGPPVDVWAMGVILFSMVTGQFPFEDIQCTIDGHYEWPSHVAISNSLRLLVSEMLELNPDLRLTVEQIRRNEWVTQGGPYSRNAGGDVIRTDVISQMEADFGMPLELVVKSLKEGVINHFTATYRMLRHSGVSTNASSLDTEEQIQTALKKLEKDGLSLDSIKRRRKSIRLGSIGGEIARSSSGQLLTPCALVPSIRKNHSGLLLSKSPRCKPVTAADLNNAVMGGAVQQVWISKKPHVQQFPLKPAKNMAKALPRPPSPGDKETFVAIPQSQISAYDRNRIRKPADFEIVARIGKGGFGTLYLSRETHSGMVCAVKKMSKHAIVIGNQVATVNAEKEILKKARIARSPWIVPLYYAFSDENHLYLAMEYCGGGDLRNLIEHVTLEEDQVRFLAAEIVASVHHFHERGFIHRDLKPSNFLISSSGHLRLVDFGLSKSSSNGDPSNDRASSGGLRIYLDSGEYKTVTVESKTNTWDCINMLKWKLRLPAKDPYILRQCNSSESERNTHSTWTCLNAADKPLVLAKSRPLHRLELVLDESGEGCKMPMSNDDRRGDTQNLLNSVVGTPQYMAKEILEGVGYDVMVDWWSVGCILFEMLVGAPPFSGSSAESVFTNVLSDRVIPFPPKVSLDARDIINRVSAIFFLFY
jgi:serine/threonine protein kinase